LAEIGRNELGNKRVIRADSRPNKCLLSGLARCGLCGAALIAHKMSLDSNGKRKLVSHYVCSWNNKRGNTICSNNWRKRQDELDEKVLAMIEREVLTPERVHQALRKAKADAKEILGYTRGGAELGFVERLISLGAFWAGGWLLAASWLGFKVASKWNSWTQLGDIPRLSKEETDKNSEDVESMRARAYRFGVGNRRFVLGTALNLGIGMVGAGVAHALKNYLCTVT